MILIGLGSNISGPWGEPAAALVRAFDALGTAPLTLVAASRVLQTRPFGKTDQPAFANAVAAITTALPPAAVVARLQEIERAAGRERHEHWGPRTLDLDLLDYDGRVVGDAPETRLAPLILPHPGIAERPFVLAPIAEIAPDWRHPVLGETAAALLARLEGQSEGGVIG